MTGTTSIRAVPEGVELRNSGNRIIIYRTQIIPFCDYAVDWAEQLDSNTTNTQEDKK